MCHHAGQRPFPFPSSAIRVADHAAELLSMAYTLHSIFFSPSPCRGNGRRNGRHGGLKGGCSRLRSLWLFPLFPFFAGGPREKEGRASRLLGHLLPPFFSADRHPSCRIKNNSPPREAGSNAPPFFFFFFFAAVVLTMKQESSGWLLKIEEESDEHPHFAIFFFLFFLSLSLFIDREKIVKGIELPKMENAVTGLSLSLQARRD